MKTWRDWLNFIAVELKRFEPFQNLVVFVPEKSPYETAKTIYERLLQENENGVEIALFQFEDTGQWDLNSMTDRERYLIFERFLFAFEFLTALTTEYERGGQIVPDPDPNTPPKLIKRWLLCGIWDAVGKRNWMNNQFLHHEIEMYEQTSLKKPADSV